jgi:hypothetical protein
MISSLEIKWNCSWKFWRNWNVPLVLWERSWWARFNIIYFVRFGFRIWEIVISKWFLPLKIQINSKKSGFGRKIELKNVITLEGLPFNSSMISFHIWMFKKSIHTLQNNVHMLTFPILQWVHTWANGIGHTSLSKRKTCEGIIYNPNFHIHILKFFSYFAN